MPVVGIVQGILLHRVGRADGEEPSGNGLQIVALDPVMGSAGSWWGGRRR
jgi:hypothetical protein